MELEKIDTSTTAGKAEVMRLASEGRQVVYRRKGKDCPRGWVVTGSPAWNWDWYLYAIPATPVGPDVVFVVFERGVVTAFNTSYGASEYMALYGGSKVEYRRADLAGRDE